VQGLDQFNWISIRICERNKTTLWNGIYVGKESDTLGLKLLIIAIDVGGFKAENRACSFSVGVRVGADGGPRHHHKLNATNRKNDPICARLFYLESKHRLVE